MAKLAFALVVLLGLAAAQSTCPCEANSGPSCAGIIPTGPETCGVVSAVCSGCACTSGGSLTCDVSTQNVLQFNGTADFCELAPVQVAACPGTEPPAVVTRQCCFSGTQGFVATCDLSPVPAFTSMSYVYNVAGVGSFTFQEPTEPLQVTIQMTASSTDVSAVGTPFMTPQVGTNTTQVGVPPLEQSLTTTYAESVGPLTAGDNRFNYLQGASSFSMLFSANLGESGGDASRSSLLEGCMDFTFTA